MRLHFLGTGTSFGVPVIGCRCEVCGSKDPRNRRLRHCLALESAGRVLLVDTPPELRLQLVRAGIASIEAAFLSHLHADHVHGIDDLRIFSLRRKAPLPMYVAAEHVGELETRFTYIFDELIEANPGTSAPEIDLHTFTAGQQLSIAGFRLHVLAFPHGKVRSYGFRLGGLGVVVDGKEILDETRAALEGIETLVINALWWGDPHPTHFNVEEALAVAGALGAKQTYLTHLTHRLDYSDLVAKLPEGVSPAYDGLVIEVGDG